VDSEGGFHFHDHTPNKVKRKDAEPREGRKRLRKISPTSSVRKRLRQTVLTEREADVEGDDIDRATDTTSEGYDSTEADTDILTDVNVEVVVEVGALHSPLPPASTSSDSGSSSDPLSVTDSVDTQVLQVPLILLDIDGVINMGEPRRSRWPQLKTKNVVDKRNGRSYRFDYAVGVVDQLNQWADSGLAEIRWLTTWDESARSCVAPALGLRNFALARDPAEHLTKYDAARRTAEQTFTSNEEALKSPAVADTKNEASGRTRPIIWIDDMLRTLFCRPGGTDDINYWRHRQQTLLLEPDRRDGLTPSQMDCIESFLLDPHPACDERGSEDSADNFADIPVQLLWEGVWEAGKRVFDNYCG
jgi:hypothetical protein